MPKISVIRRPRLVSWDSCIFIFFQEIPFRIQDISMLLGSQNVFPFVLCISPFICEYWPSFPPVLDLWVRSTFRAVLHDNCNSRISALCPVNMTHIWWKAVVSCNNCWKWNRVDSDHTSPPIYSVPPIGVITQSSTSRGDKSGLVISFPQ